MKTIIKENYGKHFCISLTDEDLTVAVPMAALSIMAIVAGIIVRCF